MILVALALLQAAVPEQEPAQPQPAIVAAQAEGAEADTDEAADAPDEPKMKKVCRKVSDPRLGALAARQMRCKYVPLEEEPKQ
jgi:hypothetical protein